MEIVSAMFWLLTVLFVPGVVITVESLGIKEGRLKDLIPKSARTTLLRQAKEQSRSSEKTGDLTKSAIVHEIVGRRQSMRTSARDNPCLFYQHCHRTRR